MGRNQYYVEVVNDNGTWSTLAQDLTIKRVTNHAYLTRGDIFWFPTRQSAHAVADLWEHGRLPTQRILL